MPGTTHSLDLRQSVVATLAGGRLLEVVTPAECTNDLSSSGHAST